ncbi:hypothetical protein FS782_26145 [Agrobacterium vitis]|nr:hypothetical protein [Agrobacterium vitis]
MWITPLPPSLTALGEGSHGSILNGNYPPNRLSSAWKPTAEIIKLLKETITEHEITMLFISHDLAVVQQLCRDVYILKNGRVEDYGACDFVFSNSSNVYTRTLIDARPRRFAH